MQIYSAPLAALQGKAETIELQACSHNTTSSNVITILIYARQYHYKDTTLKIILKKLQVANIFQSYLYYSPLKKLNFQSVKICFIYQTLLIANNQLVILHSSNISDYFTCNTKIFKTSVCTFQTKQPPILQQSRVDIGTLFCI